MTFTEDEAVQSDIYMFENILQTFVDVWILLSERSFVHLLVLHDHLHCLWLVRRNVVILIFSVADFDSTRAARDVDVCHLMIIKGHVF